MRTTFAFTVTIMLACATAYGQIGPGFGTFGNRFAGLNRTRMQDPYLRTADPFFGTSFNDRYPTFGRGVPPGTFRQYGHDFTDFDGTAGSIDRDLDGVRDFRDPAIRFGGNGFRDPFQNYTPNEITARGQYARDQGIGTGARSFGVGSGVGSKYAGLGAYNYGTMAGKGLLLSGAGDYYAGQGQFLQGAGDYEHAHSVAAINHEEAEYRDIRNEDYYTDTFFNKRKTNLEARAREEDLRRYLYSNRPSAEQIAYLQKVREPDELDATEYEPVMGTLNWPEVLRKAEFADERTEIDRHFANRSDLGPRAGLGSENYREIREEAEELKEELRNKMDDLTPMEYITAKNFLNSVVREAREEPEHASPVAAWREPGTTRGSARPR